MVFCGCLWDPLENTQLSFSFYGSMDDEAELLLNLDKCKDILSLHLLIAKEMMAAVCNVLDRTAADCRVWCSCHINLV